MNKQQIQFYADQIRSEVRSGGEVLKAIEVMVDAANAEPGLLAIVDCYAREWQLIGLQALGAGKAPYELESGDQIQLLAVPHPREPAIEVTVMVFERAVEPMQKEE